MSDIDVSEAEPCPTCGERPSLVAAGPGGGLVLACACAGSAERFVVTVRGGMELAPPEAQIDGWNEGLKRARGEMSPD